MVLIFCLLGLHRLKFKLALPKHLPPGLGFVLIGIISLILTPLNLSLTESAISFSYILRFFLYLLFGWTVYSGAFPKIKMNIAKIFISSGIGLAIIGLLQLVFLPNLEFLRSLGWDPHFFRTVSTFLDPNFAGAYFVLTFLLLTEKKYQKIFLILTFAALLTTFSRSAYLMFLISGLTLSYLKKSKVLAFSFVILFLILLAGFYTYGELVAKPRSINREQSASFRLNTWQQGLTIFEKNPIFGVGFNAYKYALREYKLADVQFLDSRGSSSNDSSILFILSTTGLIGFIIYSLFIITLVKSSLKNNFIFVSGLCGLLIHSFFANSLFYPFILIWIFLISGQDRV